MTLGLPGRERRRHGGLLPDGEAETFGGFPAPAGRTAARRQGTGRRFPDGSPGNRGMCGEYPRFRTTITHVSLAEGC